MNKTKFDFYDFNGMKNPEALLKKFSPEGIPKYLERKYQMGFLNYDQLLYLYNNLSLNKSCTDNYVIIPVSRMMIHGISNESIELMADRLEDVTEPGLKNEPEADRGDRFNKTFSDLAFCCEAYIYYRQKGLEEPEILSQVDKMVSNISPSDREKWCGDLYYDYYYKDFGNCINFSYIDLRVNKNPEDLLSKFSPDQDNHIEGIREHLENQYERGYLNCDQLLYLYDNLYLGKSLNEHRNIFPVSRMMMNGISNESIELMAGYVDDVDLSELRRILVFGEDRRNHFNKHSADLIFCCEAYIYYRQKGLEESEIILQVDKMISNTSYSEREALVIEFSSHLAHHDLGTFMDLSDVDFRINNEEIEADMFEFYR